MIAKVRRRAISSMIFRSVVMFASNNLALAASHDGSFLHILFCEEVAESHVESVGDLRKRRERWGCLLELYISTIAAVVQWWFTLVRRVVCYNRTGLPDGACACWTFVQRLRRGKLRPR